MPWSSITRELNEAGRVYILAQEGYSGFGFDLRPRKSWALWGASTPLRTTELSPPVLCLSDDAPFPAHSFLIGNHADELTPWLPLLSALTPRSAFLNIPCCLHTLASRFTSASYTFPEVLLGLPYIREDMARFDGLASERGGRYSAYLNYMAELTVRAGWRPEREALRIPSTKCWAFVGRSRYFEEGTVESRRTADWIRQVAEVAKRTWTPRKVEGHVH